MLTSRDARKSSTICFFFWLIVLLLCLCCQCVDSDNSTITHLSNKRALSSLSRMRRFFIVAQARSGSGWLKTLLNSHSRIACADEIINLQLVPELQNVSTCGFGTDSPHNGWTNVKRLLDRFFFGDKGAQLLAAAADKRVAVIGCKLLYPQFLTVCGHRVREYARRHNIAIVQLRRRNVVREAVSFGAMLQTIAQLGSWQALLEHDVLHPNKTDIDNNNNNNNSDNNNNSSRRLPLANAADALRFDSANSFATTIFSQNDINEDDIDDTQRFVRPIALHQVFYEDLVADPRFNLRLLQLFLDVEPEPLHSSLIKMHPDTMPIEKLIRNADEFRSSVAQQYDHLFC
jgi:hypothetical protein